MANLNYTATQINSNLLRASLVVEIDAWRDGGIAPNTGTDVSAALNTLMAAYPNGAIINLAPGTYSISSTINMGYKCCLRGQGKRVTIITCLSGFTGSFAVLMGPDGLTPGVYAFDCYLQDLGVNCSDLASLGGVTIPQGQEGCGLRNVTISHFTTYGVYSSNNFGSANMYFNELELYGTSGNTASMYLNQVGGITYINRITVLSLGSNSTTTTSATGIYIQDSKFYMSTLHFEGVVSGLAIGGNNTTGLAVGVNGSSGSLLTNCVDYQGGATRFRCLNVTGGTFTTNTVKNSQHGAQLITDSIVHDTATVLGQNITPPTVTLGTSPAIVQNVNMYNTMYIISGSNTSKIEFVRDTGASPTWLDTGLTQGQFILANRDRLRITYSVAPTITTFSLT